MKFVKNLLIICLCAALLLSGCGRSAKQTNVTHDDIAPLYTEAVTNLNMAGYFTINIITGKTTNVGNESFAEERTQSIVVNNYGSEQLEAQVSEAVTINGDSYKTEQFFSNGTGYLTIENEKFFAPMTSDAFLAQFAPVVLLNIANYNTITSESTDAVTTLHFTNPIAAESWANCENAELISASGSAVINSEHQFLENHYQIEYRYTSASIALTTDVTITYSDGSINLPDISEYREVSSIEAPQALEAACIYMRHCSSAAARSEYYIDSKAFGVNRKQNTHMTMSGENDTFTAYLSTDVAQENYSRRHAPVSANQVVTYKDHMYSVTQAPDPANGETTISWTEMQEKCRTNLLGNIPTPAHIQNTTISESSDYIMLTVTATPEMGANIINNASQALYGDAGFIEFISDSIDGASAECYLTINEKTGLPTSCGFTYQTNHNVDGTSYPISAQFHQSYALANTIAEPADGTLESAAPLFYQVTGSNGANMWILATTQYGDHRSDNLPQTVYDALTSSDTVITEYAYHAASNTLGEDANNSAFNRSNPGSNNDNYLGAQFYMHVSGNIGVEIYNRSAAYWSYVIARHALEQDHRLSQKQSILNNILQYAATSEKKIEVMYPEGCTIQFISSLSEAEQEAILTKAVENLPAIAQHEYDLYSALCNTDTAALTDLYISEGLTQTAYATATTEVCEKLQSYLQSPVTTFAVIDASYLVMENNLLTQLDAAGYTVDPVTY